jgi:hypothetical protein
MPFTQAAWGFVPHACPTAQIVHWPFVLHTWLVPQLEPAALAAPSTHVCAPVAHDVTPLEQRFGLPVHDEPAVQATHAPLPSQTWLVPQAVPADRLPKSRQTDAPV